MARTGWRSALCAAVLLICTVNAALAEVVLQRGNRFEPGSLDPHKYQTHYEANIILDLFEGLLTYDAKANAVPGIAQSWTTSADGRTWTFNLRPDLVWSDGAPLTADDVVFSFRRLMVPTTAAQYAQLLYILENGKEVNTGAAPADKLGVAAPTKTTVVLKLNSPAPYLLELLANPFAAILPKHVIEKKPSDWVKPGVMVSNGAYALSVWNPQDRIEVVRNLRFHDNANVKIDKVVYSPTENISSALARFRAGELDMQIEFPASQIDTLKNTIPEAVRVSPSLLTYYLTINSTNPKLSDARLRRALSLAIERDVLVSRVTRLGETVAFTFVPPGTANYQLPRSPDAALTPNERLTEAQQLMAELGYGPSKPFKLSYSFSSNEDLKRIAVAIAGMWKRIGVEAELLNREGRVHFAGLKSGDFEVGYVGWAADFNDASSFLYVLQSSSINSNYSRYRNPAFEALMVRAAQERDVKARASILQDAEMLALKDQPIIPLYNGVARNLVAPHVQGWQPNTQDFNLTRYLSISPKRP